MTRVAAALVHHPCVDKHGVIYTTSITNLDVHDIARSARTYGLDAFYVVTPVTAQQEMARAIARFWEDGRGRARNPSRTEAMQLVHVVPDIDTAVQREVEASGSRPHVVATSAKRSDGRSIDYGELRDRMPTLSSILLVFGTGHGLAPSVLEQADHVLVPLVGRGPYNHLSVRSAAAIIFDRLLSPPSLMERVATPTSHPVGTPR